MIKYLVEFIGTFLLLSVIVNIGEPIPIATALLAAIYLGANISGAHFNPVVSFVMYLKKTLPLNDLALYVLAQLAGGFVALHFKKLA